MILPLTAIWGGFATPFLASVISLNSNSLLTWNYSAPAGITFEIWRDAGAGFSKIDEVTGVLIYNDLAVC